MQTMPVVQCPSAPMLQGRTRASSSHLPGRSQTPSLRAPPIRCSLPVRLRLPQQTRTRTRTTTTTTTGSAPEQPASLRWTRAGPGSPHPSRVQPLLAACIPAAAGLGRMGLAEAACPRPHLAHRMRWQPGGAPAAWGSFTQHQEEKGGARRERRSRPTACCLPQARHHEPAAPHQQPAPAAQAGTPQKEHGGGAQAPRGAERGAAPLRLLPHPVEGRQGGARAGAASCGRAGVWYSSSAAQSG